MRSQSNFNEEFFGANAIISAPRLESVSRVTKPLVEVSTIQNLSPSLTSTTTPTTSTPTTTLVPTDTKPFVPFPTKPAPLPYPILLVQPVLSSEPTFQSPTNGAGAGSGYGSGSGGGSGGGLAEEEEEVAMNETASRMSSGAVEPEKMCTKKKVIILVIIAVALYLSWNYFSKKK